MDEGTQSRREGIALGLSPQPPQTEWPHRPEAEEAIRALRAEIMDAYGLCRPLSEMQGRVERHNR
ncbi:MAG TPA: hypothetical protein VK699_18705 [Terriglobales bacterium]|jgi:hypothetical protein|nr:hypothetical protein [Terriglobales bacterium]